MSDPNPIVFFQIATTPEGRAFYEALFGWTVTEGGAIDPGGPADFDVKGAFLPLRDGRVPAATLWFRVLDLWATFDQAQTLGAEVIVPITQRDGVSPHIALVRAPDGQALGLVQA